jgi:hypothetical protein
VTVWALTIAGPAGVAVPPAAVRAVTLDALRAGGESPRATLTLDAGRVSAADFDPPPLRAAATLAADGAAVLTGLVAEVRLGATITLTLEL